jgi:hypothetical protein
MSTAARSPEEISADFERYMRGEPLTEELASMRDGRRPPSPASSEAARPPAGGELTRMDRVALRETVQGAGWGVFGRLQQRAIQTHVDSATRQSQDDPLADPAALAQEWAYVKIFRRACAEMQLLVEAELKELADAEREERQARGTEP